MAMSERPRGSTEREDEDGFYIAYHRTCKNCNVELTSRNRPNSGELKCRTCTSASWKEIYGPLGTNPVDNRRRLEDGSLAPRKQRVTSQPLGDPSQVLPLEHSPNPERQKLHGLLTRFMLNSTNTSMKEELLNGLVDFELKYRFRNL